MNVGAHHNDNHCSSSLVSYVAHNYVAWQRRKLTNYAGVFFRNTTRCKQLDTLEKRLKLNLNNANSNTSETGKQDQGPEPAKNPQLENLQLHRTTIVWFLAMMRGSTDLIL